LSNVLGEMGVAIHLAQRRRVYHGQMALCNSAKGIFRLFV
jgi:hypothetical protein